MSQQSYNPVGLESNTYTQKPAYSPDLLKTDQEYRYGKIDEFTAYMETIEPYSERVVYYMDMVQAMGLTVSYPQSPTIGLTTTVFEREYRHIDVEDGHSYFTDESGKPVGCKQWRLPAPVIDYERYGEDEALRRKIWFEKGGYTSFAKYGTRKNEYIADRTARYNTGSEKQDLHIYAKQEYKEIEQQIAEFHTEYIAGLRIDASAKLRIQIEEAPKRIERELSGKRAIDWSALDPRKADLQCHAILWDMVRFKLFLREQIDGSAISDRKAESSLAPTDLPADTTDKSCEGVAGCGEIGQRALALFVWYCQESGEYPKFDSGRIQDGYKEIVKYYQSELGKPLSWLGFRNHFTQINKNGTHNAGYKYRISDPVALRAAIARLKQSGKYPKALAMAKSELPPTEQNEPA